MVAEAAAGAVLETPRVPEEAEVEWAPRSHRMPEVLVAPVVPEALTVRAEAAEEEVVVPGRTSCGTTARLPLVP